MKIKSVAKGFTLIELLIVVLIIGILSAVALPMYRRAVERSRASDALTTMQAIAKSEHGWYLMNNGYTNDFGNLDIDLIDVDGEKADGDEFEGNNFTFTLRNNSIRATRNNNEYSIFKDYESGFIYCLPLKHYVCDQFDGVNKRICENDIQGVWHKTTSNCYITNKERCLTEYGTSKWISTDPNDDTKGYCGYKGVSGSGYTLTEGMRCGLKNSYNECSGLILKDGAECHTSDGTVCAGNKIYNGSACVVDAGQHSMCNGSTIYAGGKCVVKLGSGSSCGTPTVYGTCEAFGPSSCCGGTIEDGGICVGKGDWSCGKVTVKSGGTCIAYNSKACKIDSNWNESTYESGSTCQGEVSGGCSGLTNMKGTCIANKAGACTNNTYDTSSGGCCKGPYCPTNDDNVVLCPED